jgi:hypothetical protein
LVTGTLQVELTIEEPTPSGPIMPNDCLIITPDGKTCEGIKAGVDLSLYDEIDIPEGVETIKEKAFEARISSGLGYIIKLPNSLLAIEESAFSECVGIKKVQFGDGLSTIGRSAFLSCSNLSGNYCNS